MDVSELGEFALIARLRGLLPPAGEQLIVGPGDDAAVWRSGGQYAIATTDTMVAGVHFLPDRVSWQDVGWKSLAVNLSDIAAMGGTPSFALVTLHLPPHTPIADLDELYAGLRECAAEYGVEIAGGDIVSSPVFAMTVALTGVAAVAADGSPLLLRRDAARPGDIVAVTGPLGGSAGGLRALIESTPRSAVVDALVTRHMRPRPRLDAGGAAIRAGIRCAIDISDGLAQDLGHICEASSVGAELSFDALPVDAALTEAFPADARALAASGGEDYELILVAKEPAIHDAAAALDSPLAAIGRISDGGGVRVVDAQGRDVALASRGWDHLARAGRTA